MRRCLSSAALALALTSAFAAPVLARDGETGGEHRSRTRITPYIQASQVVTAELQPGSDVFTYTRLGAGVDAAISGRNSTASVSLRYERSIGWDDNVADVDTLTGIARGSLALVPRTLTLEAGGMAARTRIDRNGATSIGGYGTNSDSTTQIYSVYAGPSLQTNVGDVAVSGAYLIGYSRVDSPDVVPVSSTGELVDVFDDSISQSARLHAGIAPNTVLPVGLGVGAGWNRQDVSNLDQRVDDRHVRADITVPVTREVALIGGVGYEDVEVSTRDALRDSEGRPVIGADGRFVTDDTKPRQIAYDTDGLIWDVGVMWRPSRRTSLTASVGRRYDSSTYYGSLSYAPNANTSLNVSVFDEITGFGGQMANSLNGLSTSFQAIRNPVTGDLGGCVGSLEGGNCTLAGLGSLRSAIYRRRGVSASFARTMGRTQLGLGLGYERRKYIAAPGTVLAAIDGLTDENYWISAFATRRLDRRSSLNFGASASWFETGLDNAGSSVGYSATLSYYRSLIAGLSGTAAVGLDGISRESLPDYTSASALVGLRYSF
ncbi:preprotein translocase subunit YajC [Aurantiacibacter xanthus]|uniref:Preprotein translocase subunit YajC n=1 Tax=Aurantiacibacter xanthus TaxID=1784712 RepID=A0A3A1PBK6_9SPHN|nr:preprotein translocase subunit YajC [Aurantiacibacter xanthus]RIV90889.1 preprotein translocase subunit YajC [Aurantiacibacter xanthus]